MSSASPPTWKYRVCMRYPVTSSNRSRICSRSRNAYQNIEIAPSSSADRAEPDEMRVDAVQLAEERAHPRRLRRDLELEQLLDRADEDVLVVLEGDVVDALGVRDALPPRLVLHVLLEAGVEVADHRFDAGHVLAVEVDDQAEHAVRRRVVRAEVDRQDVARRHHLRRRRQHRRRRARDARARVDRAARRQATRTAVRVVTLHPRTAPARRRADSPCAAGARPSRRRAGSASGSGARRSGSPSGRTPRARGSRRSATRG